MVNNVVVWQDSIAEVKMFRRIFEKIRKEKIKPEEVEEKVEEELTRKPSGTLIVNYHADNGDFTVATEIHDTSDESAGMMSLLLMHMQTEDFQSFVFEALRLWAGDDDEKIRFNVQMMLESKKLDSLVIDTPASEPAEDVAVSASTVFNFKEMRG